jgi:hypothetical protein
MLIVQHSRPPETLGRCHSAGDGWTAGPWGTTMESCVTSRAREPPTSARVRRPAIVSPASSSSRAVPRPTRSWSSNRFTLCAQRLGARRPWSQRRRLLRLSFSRVTASPGGSFSAFHRVTSDELWHHYDGDPLELHVIDERDGAHRVTTLGRDIRRGERPQHVVPAGAWQAAVPRGDRYTLCGCTVAPGFDFADFEMPTRADLLARFPQHVEVIARLARPS